MKRLLFVLFVLGSLSTGCATVFNFDRDRLHIYAHAGVRRVLDNGVDLRVTQSVENPATYEVRLNQAVPHMLTIVTGRSSHFVRPTTSVGAGWIVLDLLVHAVICPIVDAATGAWRSWDDLYLFDPPADAARAARALPSAPPPPPSAREQSSGARETETQFAPMLVAPWNADAGS